MIAMPRNDEKITALRMKYGWEGYGLFWAIIERLRDNSDFMSVCDYNIIAYDLRTDAAKIKSIICDFGLFAFTDDGKCFYSKSLSDRMIAKENTRLKLSESGQKGNAIRWGSGGDRKPIGSASQGKENKGKEKKVVIPKETNNDFLKFQDWINANTPKVGKMKKPFTENEFLRLKSEFGHMVICEYLLKMENYKPLLSKSESANLTIRNWINRDMSIVNNPTKSLIKPGMIL